MAKITTRTATIADLDAIVKIAVDVIPQEPQVLYQYPYTDQFPEDCHRCTTQEIKSFFANDGPNSDILVMVAEVKDEKSPSGKTVIAHTVWDLMAVGEKPALVQDSPSVSESKIEETKTFNCAGRRDADWDRIKFYSDIISKIVWKYLEPSTRTSLPRSYIHLIRVATLPQWQRHGAGTALCNWGFDVAQKYNLQIGLFATPSGEDLYTKLGFKELTKAFVQMPDEKESVSMTVMKWYPKEEGFFAQALGGIWKIGEVLGRTFCGK